MRLGRAQHVDALLDSRRADRAPDGSGARPSPRSARTHPGPNRPPYARRASTPWKSGVSASTAVSRVARLDRANRRRIVRRAAVRQVVAIDRGQHHVFEPHELDRARHVLRLLGIEPAARIAGIDRTEAAGAGANRAHQHDGGGAGVPALADVRALRLLADRAQPVLAHDLLDRTECGAGGQRRAQPRRLARIADGWAAAPGLMPSLIAVKPCGVRYFSPLLTGGRCGCVGSGRCRQLRRYLNRLAAIEGRRIQAAAAPAYRHPPTSPA